MIDAMRASCGLHRKIGNYSVYKEQELQLVVDRLCAAAHLTVKEKFKNVPR